MTFSLTFDDASFNHLVVQIIALSGALTNTGEDWVSSVIHGDVVDQLHDNHLMDVRWRELKINRDTEWDFLSEKVWQ